MASFIEYAPWANPPKSIEPALPGQITADVAIIGGGFTGLNCAINLRDAGVDVVLLESDFCGAGASGRNAGHLTPTAGKDFPTLVRMFGEDRAVQFADFAERAVHYTEGVLNEHKIDCDYVPNGNVISGVHPKQRRNLEKMCEQAARLGINTSFLDEADVRKRELPPFVKFGALEASGGLMNPGKYVRALRQVALDKGVRIYEGTRVTGYRKQSQKVVVTAERGTVSTDKLIVATNAYTPATLGKKKRIMPLRVTLFRTPVLTSEQREALKWTGQEGIYTAHEALENFRLTADGRISGGSKYVKYGFGSSLPDGNMPALFKQWEDVFAQRFGYVPDLKIEQFWGGWIGMTMDFLPVLEATMGDQVIFGVGLNGHGIAQGTMMGKLLADTVLDQPNPDRDLLNRKLFPLPPEPLRWLGVKALSYGYDRADRKIDADIAAGRT